MGCRKREQRGGTSWKRFGLTRHQAPPGPCNPKESTLGLVLCFCSLEILNNFVFELGFCKSSLVEPGSTCLSRGDVCSVFVCHGALLFETAEEHRMRVDPQSMGLMCS